MASVANNVDEGTIEELEPVTLVGGKKRFRWDKDNKIDNLIRCLANYKSQMEFKNSDFEADRVKQYECVRVSLANIYVDDPSFFGPPSVVKSPLFLKSDESLSAEQKREKQQLLKQQQEERNQIKKGYQRVQEKIKEIRQNFSTAVTLGRRSGSGKVVLDFYDELVRIWGGSASVQPLSCGTSSEQVNSINPSVTTVPDDLNEDVGQSDLNSSLNSTIHSSSLHSDEEIIPGCEQEIIESNAREAGLPDSRKRKVESTVPKLIDNKRKNMERQLSAAQRDQLLLQESREDSQFKRDIAEAMRQSNQTFSNCMQNMSTSLVQVAQSFTQSMEVMGRALMTQNQYQSYPQYNHFPNYANQLPAHQANISEANFSERIANESMTYQTL